MNLVMPDKHRSVATDLRRALSAEKVKDDPPTLTAYAVDASMYRVMPQAVVLPDSEADIETVMAYAVRQGVPLTPRAAGTNLTGSAVGSGIILDVSRMNRILEVNNDERWARVQPGIVYAELNKRLAPAGLVFGPDPSSGEMCKLGGMLANNSAGPHTLRHGSVKDNVAALRVCLETSGWLDARPYALTGGELSGVLSAHPALQPILDLTRRHAETIRTKQPRVSKNSSGYNLFGLAEGLTRGVFDLPRLFIGSEGTLGIISEATLQLVPRPTGVATLLFSFHHLDAVGEAVVDLLTLAPSALEVMDRNTLDLIGRRRHGIAEAADAVLLAEFEEEPDRPLAERVETALSLARRHALAADPLAAFEKEQRDALWQARKALYPTLYRYDRRKKPINFVDDVVVPAVRLGDLIRYLQQHFGERRIPVAVFGHIGNGNAHILPLLDVNDRDDFSAMVESYEAIHRTVLDTFGGSICGEHGDGRVRAEFMRRMFGDELYDLFVQVKRACDPANVLNPGIKISNEPFTANIDYVRLGKSCATCAKCNSVCPVYDVFQSEDMSSRGWYEIVTAGDYSYLNSKRVVEACLNCKSCRTVCPAGVDVSDLILQRRAEHPNRAAGLLFALHARPGLFEPLLKLAARTQRWWDRPMGRKAIERVTRPFLQYIAPTAGIPADLMLPRLAARTLRDRYPELVDHGSEQRDRRVAYFHGCAANYFDDGVGDAVIKVLRALGYEPALPPQRCSGTPIQTYGLATLTVEGARENVASLAPYDMVVTGCASCTLMLKDYPSLLAGSDERAAAERLAGKVRHISEVGADHLANFNAPPRPGGADGPAARRVTYHSSCHLRAAGVTKAPRRILSVLPGYQYVEMQDADRCAGGAGTYVVKDYDTSQRIFERKRRAIDETGAEMTVTSCPACMIQLRNGMKGKVQVRHIAQVLDDLFSKGGNPPNGGGRQ